ncbi:Crp/Fnr family transcriptional regulator [Hymenobacter terrenus]|uniref:Crp/Fnr family transcriptional regulator n=1 Tax=Hymenobacter terrenus TaxID=1629124 RepID=UPI0006968179|nr:cyclic nucleotide-binding domain-containing protein [Hymenobacter terrenus]
MTAAGKMDESYEALRQYICQRAGVAVAGLDEVLNCFRPTGLRRGHFLLRAGEVCRSCYFLVRGCVQVYEVDVNGVPRTRELFFENQFLTDLPGFLTGRLTTENFRGLEPCQLLAIGRDEFQQLQTTLPTFARLYEQALEASYAHSVHRIKSLLELDGAARLRWLWQTHPGLLTRLSNKVVASYLHLSPATLSRLKHTL